MRRMVVSGFSDSDVDRAGPVAPRPQGSGIVALLAMLVLVLVTTTVGFGAAVAWLATTTGAATGPTMPPAAPSEPAPRTSSPAPTPTPTPTPELPPVPLQRVQGFDVGVVSAFELGDVVIARAEPGEISLVHAMITNPLDTAASPVFDVTSYDAEGRIITRHVSVLYLLPHQETLFRGFLPRDLTQVDRILIEQTGPASEEPTAASGDLAITALAGDGGSRATVTIASTLDTEAKLADVYLVGSVDGEIVVVGNTVTDIPAGQTFTVDMTVYLATRDDPQKYAKGVPADADYNVFFELADP